MTHKLSTNYAKNYCNRALIVKVIVENVVTCFLGHGVDTMSSKVETWTTKPNIMITYCLTVCPLTPST